MTLSYQEVYRVRARKLIDWDQAMPEGISPQSQDMLAMALVPGLGPRLTAALIKHLGSAAAVLKANPQQLRQVPYIGEKLSEQFVTALRSIRLDGELEQIAKHHVRLLALGEAGYPEALAQIPDSPPLLYYRGSVTEADGRAIAIVGSRSCTAYGRRMADRIATELVRAGYTIVSGLARGIDGVAHAAALKAGGRTIAVMAGGLSSIYPPEHVELSVAVSESGCLLSETPMTLPPQPGMFHARNRIISGLAKAVVIIEASDRSGALITASHAAEQDRQLFALPGNADSLMSAGTLRLIRDGARPIRNADDILEDLAGLSPVASPAAVADEPSAPPPAQPPPQLDDTQIRVWESLAASPRHIDDLVRELGIPVAALNGILMMLEMKKAVRRLPGNLYERR
jgi:DNA processing protein